MAETVAVHHPQHPGSDTVVSRKAFDVDLSREGYLIGYSDGSAPPTAPTPAAQDGGFRVTVDSAEVEAMRLRLQGVEERETALVLREVELDRRELNLRDRETGPVAADVPAVPDPDAARKAARAQAERDRRARLRDEQRDGRPAAVTTEPEGSL